MSEIARFPLFLAVLGTRLLDRERFCFLPQDKSKVIHQRMPIVNRQALKV
jgi:hypothetical protein